MVKIGLLPSIQRSDHKDPAPPDPMPTPVELLEMLMEIYNDREAGEG